VDVGQTDLFRHGQQIAEILGFCQVPRQSETESSPWAVLGRIRAHLVVAEQQMQGLSSGSANVAERLERRAQGYRRFRCRECGRQFNERAAGVLNRTKYPSDVIALVVLWRLRYRLTLRDLSEVFLARGLVFGYEAVREWEAKLTPILSDELRQRRSVPADAQLVRGRDLH
jgi:transposase-like protein